MSRLDEIREAAKARLSSQGGKQPDGGATVLEGPKPKGVVKDRYQAFAAPTGDQQMRLIIYAKKFYMMPQYSVLYDVFFEGKGESIALIFPHHKVYCYGRNLLPLAVALRTNSVEWVKEFDPLCYKAVTEEDEEEYGVIESIEIATTMENPLPPAGG